MRRWARDLAQDMRLLLMLLGAWFWADTLNPEMVLGLR